MRISRGGAFAGGIAVTMVIGTGTAVATNGASLLLGKANATKAVTALANKNGTPLSLTAKKGSPPLKVSSTVKVKNLNADELDGRDASSFLPAGGKAADASELGGLPPSAFLPATGTAADSGRLGGQPASAFLPATGTAADASKLGGLAPSSYGSTVYGTATTDQLALKVNTPDLFDTVNLPPATYLVQFTATLTNPYTVQGDFSCDVEIRVGDQDNDVFTVGVGGTSLGAAAPNNQTTGTVTINQIVAPASTASLFAECSTEAGNATGNATIEFSTLTATRIQNYVGTVPTLSPAA
jgi:hypothetical protein